MRIIIPYIPINLLLFVVVVFYQHDIFAQQTPLWSGYNFNAAYYNPAAIGNGQISLLYRKQWTDFDAEIAPTNIAIFSDFSNLLPFSDKIGIGLNLQQDKTHIFKRTNVDLSFAYHLRNRDGHRFSLGVMAGILNQGIDFRDTKVGALNDLALYDGTGNSTVFDGGPGVYYAYSDEKNELSFSFSLPQLFTSDLNYNADFNQSFDNRFHILAGLNYRINLDNISLTPSLLFRGANGLDAMLAKTTVDLSLGLSFLNNRLHLNGGTRLNGNTFIGGVGFLINEKLSFHGIYEQHQQLGTTYEFALTYHFKEQEKNKGNSKTILTSLKNEKLALNNIKDRFDAKNINEFKVNLKAAQDAFNQANYQGLTFNEISQKVQEAEWNLNNAKSNLTTLLANTQSVLNTTWTTQRIVKTARIENTSSKRIDKVGQNIMEEGQNFNNPIRLAYEEYLQLNKQINTFKVQKGNSAPVEQIIRSNDIAKISDLLISNLSKIPDIEGNTKLAITPTNKANQFNLRYAIPYNENSYQLGEGLNKQTILANHIAKEIKTLQNKAIKIESIKFKMLLQDEIADMQSTISSYPYLGEFGEIIPIKVSLLDKDTDKRADATIRIEKWEDTSIIHLSSLKLYGVRRYLLKNGLVNLTPSVYEISGPNYDEEHAQTLIIELLIQS